MTTDATPQPSQPTGQGHNGGHRRCPSCGSSDTKTIGALYPADGKTGETVDVWRCGDCAHEWGEIRLPPVLAVAWALFADDDATYVEGTYTPGAAEIELAALFIDSLATRGYSIRATDRP
jgi:hypothetical protein